MKTVEYKVFNLSEVTVRNKSFEVKKGERPMGISPITMIDIMNEHGAQGWEICLRLNDNAFLMKRLCVGEMVSTKKG